MKRLVSCSLFLLFLHGAAHAADVVLDQILPLTGPVAPTGQGLMIGAKAYIDSINAAGGVNGNRIVLNTHDDLYKADEALRLARKAITDGQPLALMNFAGVAGAEAVMKSGDLEKNRIPLIGPRSGVQSLRNPVNSFVFHTYSSYWDEVEKMVDIFSSTGSTRFAVFYQDDVFGKDGYDGVLAALKKRNLTLVAAGTHARGSIDVAAAGAKIKAADPQVVIFCTTSAPAAEFLKHFRAGLEGVQLAGISAIDASTVVKIAGPQLSRGFVIAQNMPSPTKTSVPLVREHKAVMEKFAPQNTKANYYTLGGHATAKVIVEALKRSGAKPTRASLLAALEGMKKVDIGGVEYSYGPGLRTGVTFVDLIIIDSRGEPQS